MKSYFMSILIMISVLGCCVGCSNNTEHEDEPKQPIASLEGVSEDDIVILYTTDVHHKLDDYIGYNGVAAYKKEAEKVCSEDNLILLDGGDCLDGGNMGENTKGSGIMQIMDKVGYDVATPGNHDFKYGMDNLIKLANEAEFDYISCNLRDTASGDTVFEPYTILQRGGKNIAIIGVTTCQNPFSQEGSTDFKVAGVNENPKYDFWEDEFYEHVQAIIQEVHSEGADYVILLTHLGYDSSEFGSAELIANISGVDAVIDGHAHMEVECELLADKDGKMATITSAGEWLKNIGQMVIHADGTIETQLIPVMTYIDKDAEITQYIEQLEME